MNQLICVLDKYYVVIDFQGRRYKESFDRFFEAKALTEQIRLIEELERLK